jgi:hypothetical protein
VDASVDGDVSTTRGIRVEAGGARIARGVFRRQQTRVDDRIV